MKRFYDAISGTVRYKLLVLVLFPILLIMPIALVSAINWGKNFTYEQLFIKVKTDLSVSHDVFERIRQGYLDELGALVNSWSFVNALREQDKAELDQQIEALKLRSGFSFLRMIEGKDGAQQSLSHLRDSVALRRARDGHPQVSLEIYSADELEQISYTLAQSVKLPLVVTPRARPTARTIEDRAMVIRTLYPVRDAQNSLLMMLEGGVLLNGNFAFVDQIRDLVYAEGNLPEGSIGTVTVFLDDVRISTNVPLNVGERALGTRVSDEVRTRVLDQGEIWIDRAFVVNDWYISSYEPIIDVGGKQVGMLYAGFLEAPFRQELWKALWILVALFLALMLLSALLAIRGAQSIFSPIETMSRVVHATKQGKPERVGLIASRDEMGVLANELDAMLDLLEQRNQEIQESADQLEHKVQERTAELQQKNDDLSRTIAVLRDTRQQLVIAEKLAALGELTAGVAHEINNPTAVILGNLDVLYAELGDAVEPVKEEIQMAIQEVYRIKDIINNLLQYASPGDYAGYVSVVDVNELIEDSIKLIRHLQKEKQFAIELDLQATEAVEINPQELQQVIVNLVVNGIHALPDSGAGEMHIGSADWREKGVMISIRDNGSGIEKNKLGKIFNPFYSTKKSGQGTGLGLSISYSLIRRYGGNITVKSEPGTGSEFRVWVLSQPDMLDDDVTIAEQLQSIEERSRQHH